MPFSRVCPSCGIDTAPAVPFAHPALDNTIILCPGCGRAWPVCRARRDGLSRLWRTGLARGAAASVLAAHIVVLGLASIAASYLGVAQHGLLNLAGLAPGQMLGFTTVPAGMAGASIGERIQEWRDLGDSVGLIAWAVVSTVAGTWCGATLGHLGAARRAAVVALCVLAACLGPACWEALANLAQRLGHPTLRGKPLSVGGPLDMVSVAALSAGASCLAWPVGWVAADGWSLARRWLYARRRRRLRARRVG